MHERVREKIFAETGYFFKVPPELLDFVGPVRTWEQRILPTQTEDRDCPSYVFLSTAIHAALREVYRIERIKLKKEVLYQYLGHAISDAIINATYHGNRNDPEKRVFVACWYCENGVIVAVADEGNFYNQLKTKRLVESRTILRSTKVNPSGVGMSCIYEGADKIYVDTKQNALFIAIALDKILTDKKRT